MIPRWYTTSNTRHMAQLQPPRWLVVLLLLWLGALGAMSSPAAQTPPDSQGQQALQHAIMEGLAAGRDVGDLLQTLRHQPVPPARPPLPPRPTAAADLQAQLLAFRQILEQTTQSSVSTSALPSLERAYQQVQAAHMLMQAHFHSIAQQLSEAAVPAPFEVRRQSTASHYDALLGQLLTPLAGAMAQLRDTLDREELAATAAFRETLQEVPVRKARNWVGFVGVSASLSPSVTNSRFSERSCSISTSSLAASVVFFCCCACFKAPSSHRRKI